MKSRLIFILTAVLGILTAALFTRLDTGGGANRVHQHIEYAKDGITALQTAEGVSNLPIVCIDTHGQEIPVRADSEPKEITAYMTIMDSPDHMNNVAAEPAVESSIIIRCRGNSSRRFDKKSYAVTLIHEDGTDNPQQIMGMSKHKKWALNGPYLDRTLLRNYMCLNMAGEIMDYAPDVRYCQVYINGEYNGLYLMMEMITKGSGRVNLRTPMDGQTQTSYLVRFDRKGKGDTTIDNFTSYTYIATESGMDVRYPGENTINPQRIAYVEWDISSFEKMLYSYDIVDDRLGYTQWIDRRAFAQYFVINEFFRNVDAGNYSTYYYRDLKGKLTPVVWDFNNACDNYADADWDEVGFTMQYTPWFDALLQDKAFVDEIVYQYRALRRTVLSETRLIEYIDDTAAFLQEETQKNYELWGGVFDLSKYNSDNYLMPVERNLQSYDEAVEQLKDFIRRRGRWLDRKIDILYQYSHDSRNKELLLK